MTNLAWTLAVLDGARVPLSEGATKVLKFMIDRPDGCDAWITPGKLVMQFGPHSANHSYTPDLAPAMRCVVANMTSHLGAEVRGRTLQFGVDRPVYSRVQVPGELT